MFEYWLNADESTDSSLCDSHHTCLDSMLPGVQVTAGLGFLPHSIRLDDCEDSDSLL